MIAAGILTANHFAGLYGIGVAVMAQLSMTGSDRRARRVRPGHRQRRRHRRDGRPAGVGTRNHRPARRCRQHDEGRHQGLRDRLRSPRGARAVRLLHDGAQGRRPHGRLPALRPVGDRRPVRRRPDAVPVRLARDGGGRTGRRRGRRGGAAPVPGAPGDHGRAPNGPSTAARSTSSRARRSSRCSPRR